MTTYISEEPIRASMMCIGKVKLYKNHMFTWNNPCYWFQEHCKYFWKVSLFFPLTLLPTVSLFLSKIFSLDYSEPFSSQKFISYKCVHVCNNATFATTIEFPKQKSWREHNNFIGTINYYKSQYAWQQCG